MSQRTGPYAISDDLVQFQAERVRGRGHVVMFVDDEKLTTQSLAMLYRKDFTVLIANSAEEAIEKLAAVNAETPVCAIVSDERMPGMKGHEFFAQIREKYPLSLRILMTAYADIAAVISSINESHVYNYVIKPWIHEEFDKTLCNAVARSVLMQRLNVVDSSCCSVCAVCPVTANANSSQTDH